MTMFYLELHCDQANYYLNDKNIHCTTDPDFCYERDVMKSPSQENQADFIEVFNSTSRYRDILTRFTLTKWWTANTLLYSN